MVSSFRYQKGTIDGVCDAYYEWIRYTEEHNIVFSEESEWQDEGFIKFMAELKYPKSIVSENIMSILKEGLEGTPKEAESFSVFKWWYRRICPEQFVDGDTYQFERRLTTLVLFWRSISTKLADKGCEAAHRKPVDNLIELAFELRQGADQVWRPETGLVLPNTPESVRADAIVTKALPPEWLWFIGSFDRREHVFSWSWESPLSAREASIITFCFEAKQCDFDKVLRQLQLDFYSAQKHRRALCLKDGPVFGAILNKGELTLYVSFWKGDTLMVQHMPRVYRLNIISHFIASYFVLCRIAEFQSRWLDDEFKRWNEDKQSQMEKLQGSLTTPWRKENCLRVSNKRPQTDDGTDGCGGEEASVRGLKDDGEVQRTKAAVSRGDPTPDRGYSLTRKNIFVFNELSEDLDYLQFVSEWLERTNACSGDYTHMYSPEFNDDFRTDTVTMVGESESNVGTPVGHPQNIFDDAMMVEKIDADPSFEDMTTTSGKVLVNATPRGMKHLDNGVYH